ncbi:hypothetical protein Q7P37_011277 [Cladosporium fusiforme]
MAYSKVIVFGPTGNVGSIAAQTANKKGAKVYLAMRDPSKSIPGLTSAAEQAGNYERIQADLLQPETVLAAVQKSGAEAAFLYLAHGSQDHMKGTFRALKDGGIKHVVFLSSFTVPREGLADVPPSDLISYLHAQAELNLRQTFAKEDLVTLRPGFFATNFLREMPGIKARKAGLYGPQVLEFDFITNEDMGEVAGNVLTDGQRGGEDVIYLLGPKMLNQETAMQIVAKVLGVEIETHEIDGDQYVQQLLGVGLPEVIAKYLAKIMGDSIAQGGKMLEKVDVTQEEGYENVRKYAGRPGMEFEEWVSKNKELFV